MEHTLVVSSAELDELVIAMEAYADGWFTGNEPEEDMKAWAAAYRKVHQAKGTPDETINGNVRYMFGPEKTEQWGLI